jgi:hypothetical protein
MALILTIVLHGCKDWSLTLKERQRLRLFHVEVLKIMSETKRQKCKGKIMKIWSPDQILSGDKTEENEMGGTCNKHERDGTHMTL